VLKQSDLLILCVPQVTISNLDLQSKPTIDIWGYYARRSENVVRVLSVDDATDFER